VHGVTDLASLQHLSQRIDGAVVADLLTIGIDGFDQLRDRPGKRDLGA